MNVTNTYLDFGLIMTWGMSEFLTEKVSIKKLKTFCKFLKENREYFQYYQVGLLLNSTKLWMDNSKNKSLKDYDLIKEELLDFNKEMFKGSVYLFLRKEEQLKRLKTFEIKDENTYLSLLELAVKNSLNSIQMLTFVLPKYIKNNWNSLPDKTITTIFEFVEETNLKNKDKQYWEEILEN